MKHLLLAILCFAFTANLSAQRVDTLLQETWSGTAWVNSQRTITTYDAACNIATVKTQTWDPTSTTWINGTLTSYTYTGVNIATALTQLWNSVSSTWVNSLRTTNTYDASSRITFALSESWTGTTWQMQDRQTYTYDANGYLATTLSEIWNTTSASWVNSTLTTYTNNSDGTVQQDVYQTWNTVTSAWDNITRNTYTYNSNKTVNQVVSEDWNTTSAAWENSSRTTYTYNASGRVLTQLVETWETTQWVNSSLFTYTYDGSNHLTNLLLQSWNTGTSAWDNVLQENLTYNGDGTLHQVVTQQWAITSWVNLIRNTYSYTNSCAALPLTLLNLTATRQDNAVTVNWQTASEINTSHFTVQSSLDAAVFKNVGDVPAKGSSARANSYSFIDDISNTRAGKIYYRLVMVDKDGKSVYSKVVSVSLPGNRDDFKIRPNPAKNYFVIIPQASYAPGNTVVTVSDFSGHVVIKQNVIQSGEQKINISTLAKGIYTVSITTAGGIKTQRLKVE